MEKGGDTMEIADIYELVNGKGEVIFTGTFSECYDKKEELDPTRTPQPGEKIECWQIIAKNKNK